MPPTIIGPIGAQHPHIYRTPLYGAPLSHMKGNYIYGAHLSHMTGDYVYEAPTSYEWLLNVRLLGLCICGLLVSYGKNEM